MLNPHSDLDIAEPVGHGWQEERYAQRRTAKIAAEIRTLRVAELQRLLRRAGVAEGVIAWHHV